MCKTKYRRERRVHVLSIKALRDLGLHPYHDAIRFHQGNLSYLRHQFYGE